MDNEIHLVNDGNGVAVIGDPAAVERFLVSERLSSKELGMQRLGPAFATAGNATHIGSEIAASSGRWVKLTEDSARAMKSLPLMKGSDPTVSRAVLTENGKIKGLLEVVKTPGSIATNPAMLAGAAGLMAQLAMQQTMEEITDYLAVIDEKVDDILRAQKDAVLADMIGVDFVIEEAMTVREHVGRVSEITWSKVQSTSMTIARTQAYALRQLDSLAGKLEDKAKVGEAAKAAREAESSVHEWLAVLARCFQLQEAVGVLELDRVLNSSPDELDQHRVALQAARRNRLDLISRSTGNLVARMSAAAARANAKVLLAPNAARTIVASSNEVSLKVVDFHDRLGIEGDQQSVEARRWLDAATEVRDKAITTGTDGLDTARRVGGETFDRARSATSTLSRDITDRARGWRQGDREESHG
ncbi:hypothetical protein HLI28_07140 [Isoptericola sp. JC619]|uniref:Uncharacterized protein n=1 Tax=Isoptericola sediminis TaxID=2733572 RepID=A0A849JVE4_9MICO|nr:hypothetical protein [Isoptericola sediminis]